MAVAPWAVVAVLAAVCLMARRRGIVLGWRARENPSDKELRATVRPVIETVQPRQHRLERMPGVI